MVWQQRRQRWNVINKIKYQFEVLNSTVPQNPARTNPIPARNRFEACRRQTTFGKTSLRTHSHYNSLALAMCFCMRRRARACVCVLHFPFPIFSLQIIILTFTKFCTNAFSSFFPFQILNTILIYHLKFFFLLLRLSLFHT